jgi:5-methylcytosine-specific restriction enzyme A
VLAPTGLIYTTLLHHQQSKMLAAGRGLSMATDFEVGQIYNRRAAIHDRFGGQRQSGIVTPAKYPAIFLFTGHGSRHGYDDEWSGDGTFRYFGEGQKGDMALTKGNKAIANHAVDGKDLLLFEMLGAGQIRFRGPFNCAGYSFEDGKDQSGALRKAIVFHLVPVGDEGGELEPPPLPPAGLSFEELRKRAMAAAGPARESKREGANRTYRLRSEAVRQHVLARAKGVCESCDCLAPFTTVAGTPYLEPHHIRRLTDGGPDDPILMGAVCPNCHREIHHGSNGKITMSSFRSE